MIPLNTKPGTLVVCIDEGKYKLLPKPKLRQVYTLNTIKFNGMIWVIRLEEMMNWHMKPMGKRASLKAYEAKDFELAVLPKTLTEIFTQVPGPTTREIRVGEKVS